MRRLLHWPRAINILFIAAGALVVGFRSVNQVIPTPTPQTIVQRGETRTILSTRTVKRVVHGEIVYRNEKVYVRVPVVVVHTDHHTIRVEAHLLPIRSAGVATANPLVTVYVPVPTTVFVPTTVTETLPPSTETVTIPTTITVTLPLDPTTSDPRRPNQ